MTNSFNPKPNLQPSTTNNQNLLNFIAHQIATAPNQRITFAQFMDLALYHPEAGYYTTGAVNIGSEGDFFTSPHLSKDFGELLAVQFAQMWDILGNPTPFTLIEMGAGQGLLSADILYYLHQHYPELFNALEYIIVEKAAGLIAQQQQQIQQLNLESPLPSPPLIKGRGQEQDISFSSQGALNKIDVGGIPVRWCSFEDISENSITGCFFSNELVDAFPVHQFMIEGGKLKEIYVTFEGIGEWGVVGAKDSGDMISFSPGYSSPNPSPLQEWGKEDGIKFVEVTDIPSTPRLNQYFDLLGINLFSGAYPDGYRSEVNLAALDWLNTVASKLKRGFLLTIDYGYSAERYYLSARNQGTLQCYYRHQHHNDPYIYIGEQDITAHVNFTGLERQGELCGLRQVGFTKQGLFLMALGLGDRISALSANSGNRIAKGQDILNIMRRRDVLHQLIDPMGLGGFGVLVQSKGLTEEEEMRGIKGLTVPPMV